MNTLGFIDTLSAVRSAAGSAIDMTSNMVDNAVDSSKVSLAQFTRPALIESPNFMQASLAEEPVVSDILKNLYNVYIGYILVSLQMNDLVIGNRRIRDILGTVSTAGVLESFVDNLDLVAGLSGSLEAAKPQVPRDIKQTPHDLEDYLTEPDPNDPTRMIPKVDAMGKPIRADGRTISNVSSGHDAAKSISVPIASGRQVEIKFASLTGEPITITLNIKFNTRLLPERVVEYILSQDFTQSMANRWLQFQAGEIRFFKDLVFGVDKLNRRAAVLRADKDHALKDIFREKSKATFKHMLRVAGSRNSRSYNLANSILMLDEETVAKYTKKIGFSFNSLRDRRQFFDNTYNLFIVLVDNRFSRVTIYTNGIDQSASYSFNELKASASSDKMSLKDIMEYLSKSQLPKF